MHGSRKMAYRRDPARPVFSGAAELQSMAAMADDRPATLATGRVEVSGVTRGAEGARKASGND
jgi:hypothetical protein